ncbi:rpsU-divergently transcribed protein [Colletotrichum scovillei]|uniref:Ubiquinone biosynthesis protein n=1 Tax=Colletotrichum scovillei TaxID=1209932 RepID=A0A9P7QWK1_9PEZI|nr:rpsU-divergently transcribed protein [Colletotrichum scovillei]KAF4774541.1 rpsU-divergently transcribed protein [Colletotrichum scovillei]KAG7042912.1 rpsU-divergently transcribed protein [Colletotrichum scovillei]KAG7043500.1 rpsU-divergently transcribed protein [Colletotrichum scovillei]KAG7062949.1 rpsU-divergently transcribed protein [Colletotrichum scovillei]
MSVPCRSSARLAFRSLRQCPRASAIAPRTTRAYHSYDHPDPITTFHPHESTILSAAYKHVPEYGFSQKALALGAKDTGYLDISTSVLPDGPFSLIRYHLVTKREGLANKEKELFGESSQVGVSEKVELLAWERLLENKTVIDRWQEALAVMAQPSYVPASLKELAKLVDEIWFLSGDTAVDPSWYTKRASLSMIYASSELFMTNDKSAGFKDTRDFLRRRLSEVKEAGGVMGSLGQWVGFTASAGVNVLRSKGIRI